MERLWKRGFLSRVRAVWSANEQQPWCQTLCFFLFPHSCAPDYHFGLGKIISHFHVFVSLLVCGSLKECLAHGWDYHQLRSIRLLQCVTAGPARDQCSLDRRQLPPPHFVMTFFKYTESTELWSSVYLHLDETVNLWSFFTCRHYTPYQQSHRNRGWLLPQPQTLFRRHWTWRV